MTRVQENIWKELITNEEFTPVEPGFAETSHYIIRCW